MPCPDCPYGWVPGACARVRDHVRASASVAVCAATSYKPQAVCGRDITGRGSGPERRLAVRRGSFAWTRRGMLAAALLAIAVVPYPEPGGGAGTPGQPSG